MAARLVPNFRYKPIEKLSQIRLNCHLLGWVNCQWNWATYRRRILLPWLFVTPHEPFWEMGTPYQCEPVLFIPFLDTLAGGFTHPVAIPLGLYYMAQAKLLSNHDCALYSQCNGLVINLGLDFGIVVLR